MGPNDGAIFDSYHFEVRQVFEFGKHAEIQKRLTIVLSMLSIGELNGEYVVIIGMNSFDAWIQGIFPTRFLCSLFDFHRFHQRRFGSFTGFVVKLDTGIFVHDPDLVGTLGEVQFHLAIDLLL